jgi:hypothetical protein
VYTPRESHIPCILLNAVHGVVAKQIPRSHRVRLVIPFFVKLVYQPVLALVSSPTAAAVGSQAHATVPSAARHEACARRCEDDEHILHTLVLIHHFT